MADTLNNFNFTFTNRNAPAAGPTSSDMWNDTMTEISNDLTNISIEWTKLTEVLNALPAGTLDTAVNAFNAGLDGKTMWVDQSLTSSSTVLTFFRSDKDRPATVKEAFESLYTYVDTQLEQATNDIIDQSAGLTTGQKNAIGANIFDSTQTSSATSLDGLSENNRRNLIQVANDLYGDSFTLDNDGLKNLSTADIKDMLTNLMVLHNSNWNDATAVTHIGSFTATQADITSTHAGDDTYTASPTTLEGDLNRIRNWFKQIMGTASWLSTLTALYGGGANTIEGLLTSTSGTGVKSATNPWGYSYDNVDGLVTRLNAVATYTGMDDLTDSTPTYFSTVFINDSDSLETSLGILDNALTTTSGTIVTQATHISAIGTYTGQDSVTDTTPSYISTVNIDDGDSLELAAGKLDTSLTTTSGLLSDTLDGTQNFTAISVIGGDIEIVPSGNGLIMTDGAGVRWRLTIDATAGALVTTVV